MQINWQAISTFVILVWLWIKKQIAELSKIIQPLAEEVEQRAKDGFIDKTDRHALVMKAISLLEKEGKIKLNPISRLFISFVVNKIATKLPDFKISQEATNVISELVKKS